MAAGTAWDDPECVINVKRSELVVIGDGGGSVVVVFAFGFAGETEIAIGIEAGDIESDPAV